MTFQPLNQVLRAVLRRQTDAYLKIGILSVFPFRSIPYIYGWILSWHGYIYRVQTDVEFEQKVYIYYNV